METKKRIYMLDLMRGIAVILMVVYHLIYTFGTMMRFGFFEKSFDFLEPFMPPVIASMFILICAYSCSLSKGNLKRAAVIFAVALSISFVSTVIFPLIGIEGEEIYFGILHFLGIAVMLSPLVFRIEEKIPFYIGIPVLIAFAIGTRDLTNCGFFGLPVKDPFENTANLLFAFGIYHGDFYSADYYALFPWIFVFAIGCYAAKIFTKEKLPSLFYKKICPPVEFIGRHALIIYIVHQPVIYAVGYIISDILYA